VLAAEATRISQLDYETGRRGRKVMYFPLGWLKRSDVVVESCIRLLASITHDEKVLDGSPGFHYEAR